MTEQRDHTHPLRRALPTGDQEQEPQRDTPARPLPPRVLPSVPNRQQLREAATYRAQWGAYTVLHAPSLTRRHLLAPMVRGAARLFGRWRAWVSHDELHEAIKASDGDKHRDLQRLADRQSQRWRITILLAIALVVGTGVGYAFLGWPAVAVPVGLLLVGCWLVGRRPDPEPAATPKPEGPLSAGVPIRVLRASIEHILLDRCNTQAVVSDLRHRPDGCGWAGRLTFPGARANDDNLIEALEEGLMAPRRSVSLIEDPANRAVEIITINLTNPLADPPVAPDHEPGSLSVRDPVQLGVPDLRVTFCRTNVVLIGKTRSGKTGGIRVAADALTSMADCAVAGIDLSDGPGLSRLDDCLQPYVTTHEQAHALLEDALRLIARRTTDLKRAVKDDPHHPDDHEPTPGEPQLTIVVDEFSRLAEHACCISMIKEISVRGSKAAVNWVIGSQTATKDDLGNPAIRDSAAVLVFLACAKQLVPLLLGARMLEAGWRPDRLEPAQGDDPRDAGTCYISGAGFTLPIPQRFYTLPSAEVSRRSAAREPHIARLNGAVDAVEVPTVLAVMAEAFRSTGADRLPTAALLEHLGDGWTAGGLAEALRPYGIGPRDIRLGQRTAKGYHATAVNAAIEAL